MSNVATWKKLRSGAWGIQGQNLRAVTSAKPAKFDPMHGIDSRDLPADPTEDPASTLDNLIDRARSIVDSNK